MTSSTSRRLAGKTLLITAAAQGIGRASALACAAEGARVIATDINTELLESLAREAPGIEVHALDVRDTAAVQALAARLPALDGLFNCAGYVHHGTVLECDEAAWDFSMDLNVKSMVRTVRAFLPGMLARGHGVILTMASAAARQAARSAAAYAAAKAGVIAFSRHLAGEKS